MMLCIDLNMRWKRMINTIKKLTLIRVSTALVLAFAFMPIETIAQSNEASKSKKQVTYKKARVLQTKTAKKIAKVTEALEIVKIVQVKDTNKESETYGQMIDAEEPNPDMVTVKKILDEMNSSTVVIIGLTTDHCISTTTRMAGNYGYNTYLISDATATFNKVGQNGEIFDSELMHNTALASLNDEFAKVITSKNLLQIY